MIVKMKITVICLCVPIYTIKLRLVLRLQYLFCPSVWCFLATVTSAEQLKCDDPLVISVAAYWMEGTPDEPSSRVLTQLPALTRHLYLHHQPIHNLLTHDGYAPDKVMLGLNCIRWGNATWSWSLWLAPLYSRRPLMTTTLDSTMMSTMPHTL